MIFNKREKRAAKSIIDFVARLKIIVKKLRSHIIILKF